MLVENGLNINEIDIYGQNPIYYAINTGKLEATKLLHSLGSTIDHVDENGQTPIYYAIKSNHPNVIEYLLQNGINVHN